MNKQKRTLSSSSNRKEIQQSQLSYPYKENHGARRGALMEGWEFINIQKSKHLNYFWGELPDFLVS